MLDYLTKALTVTDVLNIIASFFTLITLVFVYLTLDEMKKQRKVLQKVIILPKDLFLVKPGINVLTVTNVSDYVALDVSVKYRYDIKEIFNILSEHDITIVSSSINHVIFDDVMGFLEFDSYKNYLMPMSEEDLIIPQVYFQAYYSLVRKMNKSNKSNIYDIDFPYLVFSLEYSNKDDERSIDYYALQLSLISDGPLDTNIIIQASIKPTGKSVFESISGLMKSIDFQDLDRNIYDGL